MKMGGYYRNTKTYGNKNIYYSHSIFTNEIHNNIKNKYILKIQLLFSFMYMEI